VDWDSALKHGVDKVILRYNDVLALLQDVLRTHALPDVDFVVCVNDRPSVQRV